MAEFARMPTPMPPPDTESVIAGLACRIEGGTAPYLAVALEPGQTVTFEAPSLLWKEATVTLVSARDSDMVMARGPGRIGFSRGLGGAIFPIPLPPSGVVQVQPGHALVASGAERVAQRIHGLGDRLSGGAGFMIDRFTAGAEGAVIWVQAMGAVFERGLMEGEVLDLRPGALLCKDAPVGLETVFPTNESGTRLGMPCLRFTGPGRVAFDTIASAVVEASEPEKAAGRRGVFSRRQG